MMYPEITSQELIARDRIKPYGLTNSTNMEEMDFEELFARIIFSFNSQTVYRNAININRLFNVDTSSVNPLFEPTDVTSIDAIVDKDIVNADMLEYDIFVKMLPRNQYPIVLNVKSVKKAKPNVVELE